METFTATFKKGKVTKRTQVYDEETTESAPKIGTLYIQQWALGSPFPEKVKVTVEIA